MVPVPDVWTALHRARSGLHRARVGDAPLVLDGDDPDPLDEPDHRAEVTAGLVESVAGTTQPSGLADLLAAAVAVRRPGGSRVLTGPRLERAAAAFAAADPAERAALAAAMTAAAPALGAYLLQLLATGRGLPTAQGLATVTRPHRHDVGWLHRHLGLLDGATGPATFLDDDGARLRLRQLSPTTCGPAAVIIMRALVDPAYALWLTTGAHVAPDREPDSLPFEQRFRNQQTRVHAALTRRAVGPVPWPRLLGVPPWSLARFLNRFTSLSGARFGWALVDPGDPAAVRGALGAVGRGRGLGLPVPLYLGRHTERHVVLGLDLTADHLRLYDPAGGQVVDVARTDVVAGRVGVAGWNHVESVLVPTALDADA